MLEKSSRIVAGVARIAIGLVVIVFAVMLLESMARNNLMPHSIMGPLFGEVCK